MSTKKNQTRDRILSASVTLLEENSGKEVRMSDIAKRAKISRQALYQHFETRAELLIETTYFVDRKFGSEERLAHSRQAETGVERLDLFIKSWGGYIPEIYGVARALIAMQATDQEAAAAWRKRMLDMREGCEAAIKALFRDGHLKPGFSVREATDILWTLLSVRNWEQLTNECGWSQEKYINHLKTTAQRLFVID